MGTDSWWTEGVDTSKPSSARVYDVYLGGSHNFEVDRQVAEEATRIMPTLPAIMRANRALLRRMVVYLSSVGVRQFLDLGSGIPTVGNVHEIAQRQAPEARIVYVDRDLIAVKHSLALLRDNPFATAVRADFRFPDSVLTHPETTRLLDMTKPVAVLAMSVLHFVSDDDGPASITRTFVDALAHGSYLALSHACSDEVEESTLGAAKLYAERLGGFHLRSEAEIADLFAGLPMVPPGLVDLDKWRPDSKELSLGSGRLPGIAGMARKP